MNSFLLPTWMLTKREIVRFYRQRSRIVGSLAMPVIFWGLLGSGLQAAFPATGGAPGEFLRYFFPANLVLTLIFTAIFCNISIIEDRKEGFLQSVLVAPIAPGALVAGKILGGALISLFQGSIFLLLAPLAGFSLDLLVILGALIVMLALSLTMTALGFAFAWKLDSVQGFHAVMNLVLFPMWLLSGSFFPIDKAPVILKPIMWLNPLSYGVQALRLSLEPSGLNGMVLGLSGAVLGFGLVFFIVSQKLVNQRTKGWA